jgi:hypothetical protein
MHRWSNVHSDWAIVRVSSRNFVRIGELAGVLGYLHGSFHLVRSSMMDDREDHHIGRSDQRMPPAARGQDKVDAR